MFCDNQSHSHTTHISEDITVNTAQPLSARDVSSSWGSCCDANEWVRLYSTDKRDSDGTEAQEDDW